MACHQFNEVGSDPRVERPPPRPYPPRVLRPRGPLACLLLLAACGPLAACDSNPAGEGRPSPLPYGYREPQGNAGRPKPSTEGEALDEITAVVWGEVLTRRRLIRETGGQKDGEDEVAFERDLRRRRVEWAKEQLFVKAAEQDGLRIVPSMLDEALEEEKKRLADEATENTGRPVSFEEVLAQQHLSEEEFRTSVKNRVLRQIYMKKLLVGLGKSARPQVDLSVSPAEVRRLYREQPELFDEKPGARFALFQLQTADAMVGEVTPVEAEAATARKAEEIVVAFRGGAAPRDIAKRFALGERQWKELEQIETRFAIPEGGAWLFDPQRKERDAQVFHFEQVLGGPVVLGVLEVRPAQKRGFSDSYDEVVKVYRFGREIRLESQRLIELVQGGAVVWPPALADDLVDDARNKLRQIEADERLSRARFR